MPAKPHVACVVEYRPLNHDGHYGKEMDKHYGFLRWPVERQVKLYRTYYKWYHDRRVQPGTLWPEVQVEQDKEGKWAIRQREAIAKHYPTYWRDFPGTFQFMFLRTGIIGSGSNFPDITTGKGRKHVEYQKNLWRLFLELVDEEKWPVKDNVVWYVGDEPIMPHYERRHKPIASIRSYVKAIRPFLRGLPVYCSAWPFDRELLASVDIWSMRPYGHPDIRPDRMPLDKASCFGKALALTLDGSYNFCIDREAINHRMDVWHTWYIDAPMLEYWSNMYWPVKPWTPKANWLSATHLVPGDGYLTYPPPKDDEVVSSIRAENLREGMEDYEYLWLLRHVSQVVRATATANESELLERIDKLLWDARDWVDRGTPHGADKNYIQACSPLKAEQMPWLAFKLDRLRHAMAETLQEAFRKGYIKPAAIDTGHKPPSEWSRKN
jgi:hypothetical protein